MMDRAIHTGLVARPISMDQRRLHSRQRSRVCAPGWVGPAGKRQVGVWP